MIWFQSALNWLAAPLSGAEHHSIEPWAYWHARMMVLSWSVFLPLGMLVARFYKVMPGQDWPKVLDRKFWWLSHVRLQGLGIAVMSLGLVLVFGHGTISSTAAWVHHLTGWTLAAIGWTQVFGGMLRGSKGGPTALIVRGDHYDMTRRRLIFEYVHKHLGWAALPVVMLTTGLGLVIVDAPRWMPLMLGGWWALMIGAFIYLQRAGRCIDTYQAIWGPDPAHPGNRRRPIGWGIIKYRNEN